MKNIMSYDKYLENLSIYSDDSASVKLSKERLNELSDQLKEYNTKKSKVEQIYKNEERSDIEDELTKLLGKDNKNPFLVNYTSVCSLERRIDDMNEDNVNDKIKYDDFRQESRNVDNPDTKKNVDDKLKDIKKRMDDRKKKISEAERELNDLKKEHEVKMDDIKKKYDEDVRNIQQ